MNYSRIAILLKIVPLMAVVAGGFPLSAQSKAQSWEVLRGLKSGDAVKVIDKDGQAYKGSFTTVSDEGISLRTKSGQTTIERPLVKCVQIRSGRRRVTETAIGVAAGVGFGLAVDMTVGRGNATALGRLNIYAIPIAIFGAIAGIPPAYATIYRAP